MGSTGGWLLVLSPVPLLPDLCLPRVSRLLACPMSAALRVSRAPPRLPLVHTSTMSRNACRCGKTQLCMTLCVTCQMPENMGGGAGKVGAGWIQGAVCLRTLAGQHVGCTIEALLIGLLYLRCDQLAN